MDLEGYLGWDQQCMQVIDAETPWEVSAWKIDKELDDNIETDIREIVFKGETPTEEAQNRVQ